MVRDGRLGRRTGALWFDGVDDYVDCGIGLNLEDITISAWIKPASLPIGGSAGIVYKRYSYQWVFQPDGLLGWGIWGDALWSNYDFTSRLDEWHHTVITFTKTGPNQGLATIYVDGTFDNSGMLNEDIDPGSEEVFIGYRYTGTSYYFDGLIDDVRIYGTALSETEIEAIYQAGMGGIVYSDPMFADANGEDYHLRSERGRYWPVHDVWVLDDVTSPAIDAGIPVIDPSNERMPNGGQVNIGAYGDSAYASMSEWPLWQDNNRDGHVDYVDFASFAEAWLEQFDWVQ